MSDWNMEPVVAAQKRRGVIAQREFIRSRKKRVDKQWTVYRLRLLFERLVGIKGDCSRLVTEYRFATEELAIRYAEKKRREFQIPGYPERVWVANNDRSVNQ